MFCARQQTSDNTGLCWQTCADLRRPLRRSEHWRRRANCARRTSCGWWSTTRTSTTSCSAALTRGRLCASLDAAIAPSRRAPWTTQADPLGSWQGRNPSSVGHHIQSTCHCAGMSPGFDVHSFLGAHAAKAQTMQQGYIQSSLRPLPLSISFSLHH